MGQALAVPELGALTLAHLRLLYWIRSRTPVTWQEARREFGASPVKTARLMRALLRRRLLERCGDPHDPRIVYLRLSAAGRLLLFRMEAYQRRYCRALLRQLSPEEQVALARSLCLLAPPEDEQRARDKE
ncbi:MAG TPA: MarR family winged helix-turn-helix transcriptional regulator [Chthonomonadaceae bacterium]|nr:MarR family winged helix-turn-helix transcriptional regulator [Chthonomonadaceae bacterium]